MGSEPNFSANERSLLHSTDDTSFHSKSKKGQSLVDMYATDKTNGEVEYKPRFRYGGDFLGTTEKIQNGKYSMENSKSFHALHSNSNISNGFQKEGAANIAGGSTMGGSRFKAQDELEGSKRRENFASQRSISYKGREASKDEDEYRSSSRCVQKSSTESSLSTRNSLSFSDRNDDSFSKYFTSLEEQTRILAEIEAKKSNETSDMATPGGLPALPVTTFNHFPVEQESFRHKKDTADSDMADALSVSVDEQAKILADIEKEIKVNDCVKRNRSTSFSIVNNSTSSASTINEKFRSSLSHSAEATKNTNNQDSVKEPNRNDELGILAKYLPEYTSSLTKNDKLKKTKSSSLVDKYLNPSLNYGASPEESPDPDMPTLQTVTGTFDPGLGENNLIDFGDTIGNNFYETLKTLKTPFSQPLPVNGTNISSMSTHLPSTNSATEQLTFFEESGDSYKRVQEIKDKYKKGKKDDLAFETLIDIESDNVTQRKVPRSTNSSNTIKTPTKQPSVISEPSDFSIAKELAISIDEQAKILAEIEREKEKKASPPAPALMKTKSKSNLKSSIKRSKSKGRCVTFDESVSKTGDDEEKTKDWNAVISSSTKTFTAHNEESQQIVHVIESKNTSNSQFTPSRAEEKRQQIDNQTTQMNKTIQSSSNNNLNLFSDSTTNHTRPKRNRERSPVCTPQASSSRTARKCSTSEVSTVSKTKVKARSSSLSAPRNNYGQGVSRRNGEINGEANRDALRQLLCDLRKDAMDDDLENNDGTFFPCEFCGDPYPVEYLMRHQVNNSYIYG